MENGVFLVKFYIYGFGLPHTAVYSSPYSRYVDLSSASYHARQARESWSLPY